VFHVLAARTGIPRRILSHTLDGAETEVYEKVSMIMCIVVRAALILVIQTEPLALTTVVEQPVASLSLLLY
jgi:hypothetical protein